MGEDDMLENRNIDLDVPNPPKKISTYDLLMRQSRKMGSLATRTIDVTKDFLTSDVSRLNPDAILFGVRSNSLSQLKSADTKASKQRSDIQENVHEIARRSHEVLAAARTFILPSNIFPDTVILDRTKITIIKRDFFWSSQIITIRIDDILHVSSNTGPFFGSINISSRVMNSTDHYEISGFWRKDVMYLKEVIQGYMIAQQNDIDVNHLRRDELVHTLLELGRDSQL